MGNPAASEVTMMAEAELEVPIMPLAVWDGMGRSPGHVVLSSFHPYEGLGHR